MTLNYSARMVRGKEGCIFTYDDNKKYLFIGSPSCFVRILNNKYEYTGLGTDYVYIYKKELANYKLKINKVGAMEFDVPDLIMVRKVVDMIRNSGDPKEKESSNRYFLSGVAVNARELKDLLSFLGNFKDKEFKMYVCSKKDVAPIFFVLQIMKLLL